MLADHGAEYEYREYTKEPLSGAELKKLFAKLGVHPGTLLRKKDKANADLGLTGDESPAVLIRAMAKNPTLLQRPILVDGEQAVVGRPVEKMLELLD